jgi:hypothetical protein
MSKEGSPHAFHVAWLVKRLYAVLDERVFLWSQSTVILDEWMRKPASPITGSSTSRR